jgi:hypothetical protein
MAGDLEAHPIGPTRTTPNLPRRFELRARRPVGSEAALRLRLGRRVVRGAAV